jgi:trk system potassium uptake protein TrkA
MRVAIVGAGSVGRSIARELIANHHQVMLVDREPRKITPHRIPEAEWLLSDAAEVANLEAAHFSGFDVVVSATGDDKVNLVVSLLAKTEFSIPRVVARINHPSNEWLFTEAWGIDVAVSTPRVLAALVEEAVSVGDLVRLFSFQQGQANLVEITLPPNSPCAGRAVRDLDLPTDAVLVTIVRGERVIAPSPEQPMEAGDELLFVCAPGVEDDVRTAICAAPGDQPRVGDFASTLTSEPVGQ